LTDKERKAGLIKPNQSYRLPTDTEWSVAVGLKEPNDGTPEDKDGKIENVFPWGTQWPPPKAAGNYAKSLGVDPFDGTSPVGSFKANQFGLFDMGGNVSQWTEDWYDAKQIERALRGSGWAHDSRDSLCLSTRGMMKPGEAALAVGFRCVLTESP
jgi:formylglycine-generating enzyme required for sulfatase activity